jgi:hypothetical protein
MAWTFIVLLHCLPSRSRPASLVVLGRRLQRTSWEVSVDSSWEQAQRVTGRRCSGLKPFSLDTVRELRAGSGQLEGTMGTPMKW